MKSVLISLQPYWAFLIIAKKMGWDIDHEKTVEVRKNFPKDLGWDKKSIIYCSKDKCSFNRIPKKYQPLMEKFLGKVIGKFVCDKIYQYSTTQNCNGVDITDEEMTKASCLTKEDIEAYEFSAEAKDFCIYKIGVYGWHISNLVIYDKPRELSEFKKINRECWYADLGLAKRDCPECKHAGCFVQRPPQSWCYVESEDTQ